MSAKAKKELTPKQKKIQTALNWTINVLCILIIIFALVLSVVTIAQTTDTDNLPHLGKSYFLAVKTDSMSGTFEVGDMIIAKQVTSEQAKTLEVGQVITFRQIIGQVTMINTHRIVEVIAENGVIQYRTQGDHEAIADTRLVGSGNVIATWGKPGSQADKDSYGKVLKGVGKINNWLYDEDHLSSSGKSTRYFLVIVLPLILLFVGYGFVMIYSLVKSKLAKQAEVAVNDLSDEDKERIAREYLASQGVDTGAEEDQVEKVDESEVPTEEVAEETVADEAPVEESAEDVAVEEPAEEVSDEKKED